ncbi:MAG: hypothetical protein ACRD4R_12630 [Candidatus Acidiferrales bacterium]
MPKSAIHELRIVGCLAGLLCAFAFLSAPVARCQDSESSTGQNLQNQAEQPIPAYRSPLASGSQNQGVDQNSQTVQPDTRPLSGAQYISMGNLTNTRSYWQPRFDLTGSADSNPQESASNSNWGAWTSFLAGVDIHHTSGTSEMKLSYTGGGMYSNENNVPSGNVEELGFTDKITFRRSVLSFLDQLNYLPQSSLGFGGVGGLPLLGNGSAGLGPGFTTGQSILTGQGQNLANSSVAQLETFLTPRSSITMAGGYSLLHFFGNNLVDSGDVIFQGGYNYQLARHDTVALLYDFSDFRYSSLGQSIYTHTVEGSYGRRVTGRLAFQIAAGPEFAIFDQEATTGGTGSGSGASNTSSTHVYWSLNSALNYQYQRTALGLNYSHGVGAGSGVLAGSLTDIVTGSLTRQMSRTFSSGLNAGYSRNSALPIAIGQNSGQNYDYWFAGASLARPLSETLALTLSYQMQYQTSNSTFCIGPSCGTSVIRHLISVGFSWHQRPLLF